MTTGLPAELFFKLPRHAWPLDWDMTYCGKSDVRRSVDVPIGTILRSYQYRLRDYVTCRDCLETLDGFDETARRVFVRQLLTGRPPFSHSLPTSPED